MGVPKKLGEFAANHADVIWSGSKLIQNNVLNNDETAQDILIEKTETVEEKKNACRFDESQIKVKEDEGRDKQEAIIKKDNIPDSSSDGIGSGGSTPGHSSSGGGHGGAGSDWNGIDSNGNDWSGQSWF